MDLGGSDARGHIFMCPYIPSSILQPIVLDVKVVVVESKVKMRPNVKLAMSEGLDEDKVGGMEWRWR